jgi:hypothetical protein
LNSEITLKFKQFKNTSRHVIDMFPKFDTLPDYHTCIQKLSIGVKSRVWFQSILIFAGRRPKPDVLIKGKPRSNFKTLFTLPFNLSKL